MLAVLTCHDGFFCQAAATISALVMGVIVIVIGLQILGAISKAVVGGKAPQESCGVPGCTFIVVGDGYCWGHREHGPSGSRLAGSRMTPGPTAVHPEDRAEK